MSKELRRLFEVTIGAFAIYTVFSKWLLPLLFKNYLVNSLVHIIVTLSISAFLIYYATNNLGFKLEFKLHKVTKPWWLLPLLLIGFWYFFFNRLPNIFVGMSTWLGMGTSKVIGDLLSAFSAGFWEEVFLRGFLLGGLLVLLPKATKNIGLKVTLISAFVFGVMHALNIFVPGAESIGVLQQVLFAIIFGVAFGALYLRTHSLLPGIIIHFLFDLENMMLLPVSTSSPDVANPWLPLALAFLPMLIMGLIYLRSSKAQTNAALRGILSK